MEPADITYSCVEGETVVPGEGNINLDPKFCGWSEAEVEVENEAQLTEAESLGIVVEHVCEAAVGPKDFCVGTGQVGYEVKHDIALRGAQAREAHARKGS